MPPFPHLNVYFQPLRKNCFEKGCGFHPRFSQRCAMIWRYAVPAMFDDFWVEFTDLPAEIFDFDESLEDSAVEPVRVNIPIGTTVMRNEQT